MIIERLLVSVDSWVIERIITVLEVRSFSYCLAGWLKCHRLMMPWRR